MKNYSNSSEIRSEANQRFMAENDVLGIAESQSSDEQLIFFLAQQSENLEDSIQAWASSRHIRVSIRVVGQFTLLKTG